MFSGIIVILNFFVQDYGGVGFFPSVSFRNLDSRFSGMDDTEVIPPQYLIKRFLERWRVGLRPDRRHGDHN